MATQFLPRTASSDHAADLNPGSAISADADPALSITTNTRFTVCLPLVSRNDDFERGEIITKELSYGNYLQYIPTTLASPPGILVIVHGSLDEGQPALELASVFIQRWVSVAEEQGIMLIAPAFDQENFGGHDGPGGGYRGLFGREIGADEFVNLIVDSYRPRFKGLDGRFYLYGHSAGGQFTNRYLVRHPYRIVAAVISAAGRYAFPDPDAPWPYGMGSLQTTMQWPGSDEVQIINIHPDPSGWLMAARLPVTTVVGELDTEPQPPRPGQKGTTRVEIALNWVNDMNTFAESNGRRGTVEIIIVPGIGHSSLGLTPTCQQVLWP